MYKHTWKPSASQKREFVENMKDPEYAKAYEGRKTAKAEKRRSYSKFEYGTAGGSYVPTRGQHDFCFENSFLFNTVEEQAAMNEVMYGFACVEKISHDSIHIVNEKRRTFINGYVNQ